MTYLLCHPTIYVSPLATPTVIFFVGESHSSLPTTFVLVRPVCLYLVYVCSPRSDALVENRTRIMEISWRVCEEVSLKFEILHTIYIAYLSFNPALHKKNLRSATGNFSLTQF